MGPKKDPRGFGFRGPLLPFRRGHRGRHRDCDRGDQPYGIGKLFSAVRHLSLRRQSLPAHLAHHHRRPFRWHGYAHDTLLCRPGHLRSPIPYQDGSAYSHRSSPGLLGCSSVQCHPTRSLIGMGCCGYRQIRPMENRLDIHEAGLMDLPHALPLCLYLHPRRGMEFQLPFHRVQVHHRLIGLGTGFGGLFI